MTPMNLFEAGILRWIQDHLRTESLTPLVRAVTHLGDAGIFWILLTLALLAFKKTRRAGVCCALALIMDLIVVNLALKPLIARIRPYAVMPEIRILIPPPGDFSFPSGHSAASFACAWAFFRARGRKWGLPLVALALLVALSRLYLGVHYPTDVIGGMLIGVALGEAGARIGRRLPLSRRK